MFKPVMRVKVVTRGKVKRVQITFKCVKDAPFWNMSFSVEQAAKLRAELQRVGI